ncbi:LOW QUALITY PROTEIN: protein STRICTOSIDINE SYNTHASE-LIKE 10 [Gossypium raimondii]|uniref:LOW QUALITY PROTEIN: protein STRICTOSIDINE SYNTHASE-LIKE 10 n=1 Tax=Gossypium raimondii TaxID=29730 RepID=UPI00227C65A3|nr:LOW QUALITY PROTEIN: protein STRICTOSIDINE SYNTHASE-LIKE 10 [Gossypium raimondii]
MIIAFDCKGEGPYVGVFDGPILKWHGPKLGWKEFAIPSSIKKKELCDGSTNPNLEPICGRPLGWKFNPITCDLYVGDAYFGLLMIRPNGGIAQTLVTSIEGIPFKFINGLDIESSTGVIYFTDSNTTFQRRYADFLSRSIDISERLLKYDLHTKNASVIYTSLMFPNGVALSKNHSFLLVAETIRTRILKFNLGTNNFEPEVFVVLLRVPDNIKMNHKGEFWVALNAGRFGEIDDDAPDPIGIKYDREGRILKQLDGNGKDVFSSITEINEVNRTLYNIGSVTKPYVAILKF